MQLSYNVNYPKLIETAKILIGKKEYFAVFEYLVIMTNVWQVTNVFTRITCHFINTVVIKSYNL